MVQRADWYVHLRCRPLRKSHKGVIRESFENLDRAGPGPNAPLTTLFFFFSPAKPIFFSPAKKKKFPLFSRLFGIFMSPSGRGTPVMELHPSSGFFCPARVWPVATIKTDSVEFCFFSPRCPPSIEKRRSKPQVTSPSRAWSSLPCPSGRSTLLALSV